MALDFIKDRNILIDVLKFCWNTKRYQWLIEIFNKNKGKLYDEIIVTDVVYWQISDLSMSI